eukprot:CAMPEP_0174966880 /NCGR_PEP_ID=MMETSP0004_2-20121128/7277_1 /TAXON_ID=420556 /ORGANISM="Ochromonas sp., Strain CCMP1393" /LENGTH=444 /DNA_ID=CAMNT_0016215957 /DNA_START=40 /DNA_END=1374 /DNA_ORIENTATION=+
MALCLASTLCECACCMGCSCFSSIFSSSLSKAARFGHLLIVVVTFCLAIWLGQEYPDEINGYNYYTKVDLLGGCDKNYEDSCIYRQLIYRASFSLFLVFGILVLVTGFSDYANKGLWIIKFGAAVGLFIAFWWVENSFFSGFAEFARVFSFFWLLIQGLLLLDFCHDMHDILMPNTPEGEEESSATKITYIVVSIGAFALALLGIVYLCLDYAGCGLGAFFISVTIVNGVLTTVVSLLDLVGRGLLTPCMMFAYSVFMCWYALLSSPDDQCNPSADSTAGSQDAAVVVVSIVSLVVLMYCVMNGTTILNIFNPQGEGVMMSYTAQSANRKEMNNVLTGESGGGVESGSAAARSSEESRARKEGDGEDESGTPHERVLYHVIMILVACYGAMILTNWGKTNGGPPEGPGENATSQESMWLKIISQWIFLGLYWRVLQVAYNNNQG